MFLQVDAKSVNANADSNQIDNGANESVNDVGGGDQATPNKKARLSNVGFCQISN